MVTYNSAPLRVEQFEENKDWEDFNGSVTDDTYLSIAVAKGILDNPHHPSKAIGKYFMEWFYNNPVGIGQITKLAFEGYDFKKDWGYAVQYAHNYSEQRSAGNGSLMRTLPVPLFYSNFKEMLLVAAEQSYLTHYDPMCKEACQLYTWLTYLLLKNESKEDSLNEVFSNHLFYGQYKYKTLDFLKTSAYVADTLLTALTIFYKTNSFEEALRTSVSLGGDRDTIGAVTCGLAGVYYGIEALPEKPMKQLSEFKTLWQIGPMLFHSRNENKEA